MSDKKSITSKLIIVNTSNTVFAFSVTILFTLLTAIGAWIEIPTTPVPFTLQTFFVLLSGAILGARLGFVSQVLYLTMGIAGIPVFSGFSAGIVKLFGPTGGYLIGFPIAAFVIGYLINKKEHYLWTLLSVSAGLFIIFLLGTLYLNMVYINDFSKAFAYGFLIFSWWDALKVVAVVSIYRKIHKLL